MNKQDKKYIKDLKTKIRRNQRGYRVGRPVDTGAGRPKTV